VYRAPGRVNLIGEHTDYNEGFVLPAAIDRYTWAAAATAGGPRVRVYSANFDECVEFNLEERSASNASPEWSDYVRGVALMLERKGYRVPGANVCIDSNVPIGSGLSSSAALEVSSALAILSTIRDGAPPLGRLELALLCQQAENEIVGTRSGIMDQFSACFGEAGHALMLDCRSLQYRAIALPGQVRLVICNTMVGHELAAGEYNARRAECEEGVRLLQTRNPAVRALRDVTPHELDSARDDLPPTIYRRCRHVVTENERVLEAVEALERSRLDELPHLMAASHASLRDDYQVSCPELDKMVELANEVAGVLGARMTGGGFGGCTVNLVRDDCVDQFRSHVSAGYARATGLTPEIYICEAAAAAQAV